ncbi:MAG: uridine kinase [FCB group bacterium]|nr:uridine kinase [FCB group bacterium]
MNNKKTILIGIAGGTGSGKTTVAKAITSEFGKSEVALIEQDAFYRDLKHLPFEERVKVNFDHPDAVDFDLMKFTMRELLMGNPIQIPVYDYTTHTRSQQMKHFEKHHIVVLEGILALLDEELREMMDIKLYVETADDIRVIRRIKRDINKRGRSFESVIKQYYTTVRPMHIQFVEPTKKYADIIIPEGGRNVVAVDIIRTKIMSILLQKNEG